MGLVLFIGRASENQQIRQICVMFYGRDTQPSVSAFGTVATMRINLKKKKLEGHLSKMNDESGSSTETVQKSLVLSDECYFVDASKHHSFSVGCTEALG